jgi:hypothetical protein
VGAKAPSFRRRSKWRCRLQGFLSSASTPLFRVRPDHLHDHTTIDLGSALDSIRQAHIVSRFHLAWFAAILFVASLPLFLLTVSTTVKRPSASGTRFQMVHAQLGSRLMTTVTLVSTHIQQVSRLLLGQVGGQGPKADSGSTNMAEGRGVLNRQLDRRASGRLAAMPT